MSSVVELNANDLQAILAIIDAASQRGVFRAQELSPVGALYEKIVTVLNEKLPNTPNSQTTTFAQ